MAISQRHQTRHTARLGSTDALRIMAGRWREVWQEKTGRAAAAERALETAVQIGIATEPLHARFYRDRTGIACRPGGDRTFVHPQYDHLVARVDFLTWREPPRAPADPPDTILEAKFNGGHLTDEEMAEQYYWQLQHQMLVAGFGQAVLSILRPAGYAVVPVMRDESDQATLLETLRAFWWHVEHDIEPGDPLAVEPPNFDRMKIVDMSAHNEFAALGGILVDHRSSVLTYREAEARLKALMPPEARIAYLPPGPAPNGIFLVRARDGKVSVKFGDLPPKYASRSQPRPVPPIGE